MVKKNIDWLNHSLEFIVVIIGILIAFQLNTCTDNRGKKKLIDNHLTYISAECKSNEEKLTISIDQIAEQLIYCDSILSEIATNKRPAIIRDYATKLLDLRNVNMDRNAYEVLSQSGDIRFLNDYSKKRNIITLYDSYDRVDKINVSNQNLYDNHFYPYLKSNFDLVNWRKIDVKDKAEEEKYYSLEFANTISTYKYLLLAKQKIYISEKNMIREYLEK